MFDRFEFRHAGGMIRILKAHVPPQRPMTEASAKSMDEENKKKGDADSKEEPLEGSVGGVKRLETIDLNELPLCGDVEFHATPVHEIQLRCDYEPYTLMLFML